MTAERMIVIGAVAALLISLILWQLGSSSPVLHKARISVPYRVTK